MVHGGDKRIQCTDIELKKYEQAVEIICTAIRKIYEPNHIILNKHYYAQSYIDDKGMHRYVRDLFDENENDKTLQLIKYIESLVKKQLEGLHIIEFPDDVLGDAKHRFGICSLHYHPMYYDYVREALRIIFHGNSDKKSCLKQLRYNYSMRFAMLKLEMLAEIKNRILERELYAIVCIGKWNVQDYGRENICRILVQQEDVSSYFDVLYMMRDSIIVLMATKDTSGFYGNSLALHKLKRLGFKNFPSKVWYMYAGIVFRGVALIDLPSEQIE